MAKELLVEIVGDARSFNRALDSTSRTTKGFSSKIGNLGKVAVGAAGAAGIGALIYGIKTGVGEFMQAQKVTARTNTVIKSTGGVAGVTAKQVGDMAEAMMRKSGIDDEAIQSGENLLLTFKNIRNEAGKGNDIFNQTTSIMTDMAAAMGKDPTQAAKILGKALDDPIKGMTALRRVGVTFTEGQQKTIEGLVESGKTMEAQKILLGELKDRYGGAAEAAGNTLPGQIAIAKETFNNFAGDLVAKAIPAIEKMIGWLRDHWPEISAAFQQAWSTIQPILAALINLAVEVVKVIQDHWGTIGPIVKQVGEAFKDVGQVIAGVIELVTALLSGDWSAAWEAAKKIVTNALSAIRNLIEAEGKYIVAVAKALGGKIKDAVVQGIEGLPGLAWDVIKGIAGKIAGMDETIRGWGEGIGTKIKNAVVAALVGIGGKAWDVINNIGSAIEGAASSITGWGTSIGGKLISGILSGLSGLAGRVVANLKAAVNAVIDQINRAVEFDVGFKVAGHGVNVHVNPPDIPKLHTGGLFKASTPGGEGLAMLRDGERVLPAGQLTAPVVHEHHYHGPVIQDQAFIRYLKNLQSIDRNRNGQAAWGLG